MKNQGKMASPSVHKSSITESKESTKSEMLKNLKIYFKKLSMTSKTIQTNSQMV
jgi:hypothetical protein